MVHPTRRVERQGLGVDVAEPVRAVIAGGGGQTSVQGRAAPALLGRQATAILLAVLRVGYIPSWPRRKGIEVGIVYEKAHAEVGRAEEGGGRKMTDGALEEGQRK